MCRKWNKKNIEEINRTTIQCNCRVRAAAAAVAAAAEHENTEGALTLRLIDEYITLSNVLNLP